MLSYSRRFTLMGLAMLAGCGFTPVYGPGGSAEALRGQIDVDGPRDIPGFALVRQLETRLGLPDAPVYRLAAEIQLEEDELGITTGQEITRYEVLGRVRFRLIDLATGDIATRGVVENFTSYSATDTAFATRSAQRDARERLMVALADQVVARLLATSGEWR